jgi:hypothetical protein
MTSPPGIEHRKVECSRSDLLFVSHVGKSPDNILVIALSLVPRSPDDGSVRVRMRFPMLLGGQKVVLGLMAESSIDRDGNNLASSGVPFRANNRFGREEIIDIYEIHF